MYTQFHYYGFCEFPIDYASVAGQDDAARRRRVLGGAEWQGPYQMSHRMTMPDSIAGYEYHSSCYHMI